MKENISAKVKELEEAIRDFLRLPHAQVALALHWDDDKGKIVIDHWFLGASKRENVTSN